MISVGLCLAYSHFIPISFIYQLSFSFSGCLCVCVEHLLRLMMMISQMRGVCGGSQSAPLKYAM